MLPLRVKKLEIHYLFTKSLIHEYEENQGRKLALLRPHISHSKVWRLSQPHTCRKDSLQAKGEQHQRMLYTDSYEVGFILLRGE